MSGNPDLKSGEGAGNLHGWTGKRRTPQRPHRATMKHLQEHHHAHWSFVFFCIWHCAIVYFKKYIFSNIIIYREFYLIIFHFFIYFYKATTMLYFFFTSAQLQHQFFMIIIIRQNQYISSNNIQRDDTNILRWRAYFVSNNKKKAWLNNYREVAHERLVGDYFAQNHVYTHKWFRRHLRGSKQLSILLYKAN